MWLPNNPLMQRAGVGRLARGGADLPGGDRRRRRPGHVAGAQGGLRRRGRRTSSPPPRSTACAFARAADYPDYYPELPGGKIGRARRGRARSTPRGSATGGRPCRALMPLPIKTDDVWLLGRAWSTPAGFVRGARFVVRTLGGAVRGQAPRRHRARRWPRSFLDVVVRKQGTPLWLNAPLEELARRGRSRGRRPHHAATAGR